MTVRTLPRPAAPRPARRAVSTRPGRGSEDRRRFRPSGCRPGDGRRDRGAASATWPGRGKSTRRSTGWSDRAPAAAGWRFPWPEAAPTAPAPGRRGPPGSGSHRPWPASGGPSSARRTSAWACRAGPRRRGIHPRELMRLDGVPLPDKDRHQAPRLFRGDIDLRRLDAAVANTRIPAGRCSGPGGGEGRNRRRQQERRRSDETGEDLFVPVMAVLSQGIFAGRDVRSPWRRKRP